MYYCMKEKDHMRVKHMRGVVFPITTQLLYPVFSQNTTKNIKIFKVKIWGENMNLLVIFLCGFVAGSLFSYCILKKEDSETNKIIEKLVEDKNKLLKELKKRREDK